MERLFAESRKFGLELCVSLQQSGQLANRQGRERVADAVLANTATKFTFRLGPSDVETMEPYFASAVDARVMARLPDFHAVATLNEDHRSLSPFVMKVAQPSASSTASTEQHVRARSARQFAVNIDQANQELIRLYDLHPSALGRSR